LSVKRYGEAKERYMTIEPPDPQRNTAHRTNVAGSQGAEDIR
jgi:hypothetical protein